MSVDHQVSVLSTLPPYFLPPIPATAGRSWQWLGSWRCGWWPRPKSAVAHLSHHPYRVLARYSGFPKPRLPHQPSAFYFSLLNWDGRNDDIAKQVIANNLPNGGVRAKSTADVTCTSVERTCLHRCALEVDISSQDTSNNARVKQSSYRCLADKSDPLSRFGTSGFPWETLRRTWDRPGNAATMRKFGTYLIEKENFPAT